MATSEIPVLLQKGFNLANAIGHHVPNTTHTVELRADLAGLLVVSIAASYESCVKEILYNYSSSHNEKFAFFIENNFKKLNSKINISDLNQYAKMFDPAIHAKFEKELKRNRERVQKFSGKDIVGSYSTLLSWRHSFAHSAERKTTIEEALKTHRLAKIVIQTYNKAFNG
ncbi:HEPN domain-containing protein [Aeromonas schubertii]